MFPIRFFKIKFAFFFFIVWTFQCATTGSNSPESVIVDFNKNKKSYRIGVLDFIHSEKQTGKYDSMISDRLIVELSKNSSNVLVERTKLAELLSEHSLQYAGLLDSDKARELGKIIPIDLILTGSYTIKKTQTQENIQISGRFIHVVTGEIVYAFNTTMTQENQDFTPNQNISQGKSEKKCPGNSNIEELLKDLSSESKIQELVERARKIPFEDECGKIHSLVLSNFIRYKIDSKNYKTFLTDSLKKFQNPNEDYRVLDSLRYFQSDKIIDEEEWSAGKDVIQRVTIGNLTRYITYLLNVQSETNKNLILKRAEEIMELGIQQKIGRPVAIRKQEILLSVLYALQDSKAFLDSDLIALIFFDKYKNIVFEPSAETNRVFSVFDFLSNHYFKETDKNKKEAVFLRIKEFLSSVVGSEQKEKKLDDFFGKLISATERAKETDAKLYKLHFTNLFRSLSKEICEVTDKNPYPMQKSSRIQFLSENECVCK
ncbi:curli production assembly/transport component CsgG domain protein [Leptospira weilii serovar Ranarum str. ICFT]|uniref:Curli production assembly/transport component CsgG domain protein n=1 Tax=Leptospira weilii serovar Ranarum str. ICFT TaxID=1218598 RepID=N1WRT0_9LEPT|nr:CsgG/HfaB family protein [Leptospira weilii]EMY78528.1 curli production assembly/transport component CsgG domain protein [Leptospira weilii serovar Ranarum str. ICFT]